MYYRCPECDRAWKGDEPPACTCSNADFEMFDPETPDINFKYE